MEDALVKSKAALKEGNYPLAWSLVTNWRFWSFWQDFLEQAARGLALLPDSIRKEMPQKKGASQLPTLVALRAESPITVDGKLNEPAWQNAPFSVGFVNKDEMPTLAETGVKALYDDRNIYFGFICADKNPKTLKAEAEAEAKIFQVGDDVLGIFLQPDETKPIYYQLAFNPKGVQFDQRVVGGDKDYEYHPEWRTAISASDKYWIAEVALPYQAFGQAQRSDTNWRVNFHRVFRNGMVDNSSWSHPGTTWHNPARFGRLIFGKG